MSDPRENALTPSTFNEALRRLVEGAFPPFWMRAEISNCRRQANGHYYFTLKDDEAQVNAVLFRGDAQRCATEPQDGRQVLVQGTVSIYAPRGTYSIVVRQMEDAGAGRLQAEFERLKAKLAAEGLFDAARKKPLPLVPAHIAIVTSPSAAALQDFLLVLKRRGWCGRVTVFPARVQGDEAPADLVAMLRRACATPGVELVVLARGGGSIEDLWAFNDETLARAIAAATKPTISAVGHEIDFTLADFAADLRAETPTAAAERIAKGLGDFRDALGSAAERLHGEATERLRQARQSLSWLAGRLRQASPDRRIENAWMRADDLRQRLDFAISRRLQSLRRRSSELNLTLERHSPASTLRFEAARVATLRRHADTALANRLDRLRQRLDSARRQLDTLGPSQTLRRGYTLVLDARGAVVTNPASPASGDPLTIRFAQGDLPVSVGPAAPPKPPVPKPARRTAKPKHPESPSLFD